MTIKSEASDEEESAARSRCKKPKRLEDQMAKMAKELEELKKKKHQGTRKNPLGEMNAPFSRRIREAELPPKFKMPAEKYFGSDYQPPGKLCPADGNPKRIPVSYV